MTAYFEVSCHRIPEQEGDSAPTDSLRTYSQWITFSRNLPSPWRACGQLGLTLELLINIAVQFRKTLQFDYG